MEEAREAKAPRDLVTPEEAERRRKREALALSRARVQQQLQNCRDPRYERMLQAALADLERQLEALGDGKK